MTTLFTRASALVLSAALSAIDGAAIPPARAHHSIVYDASGRRVLVAGGSTSPDGGKTYSTFADLWSFDGHGWRALGPSGAERSGMALAFDSRRKRVLAFGGYCPCRTEDGGLFDDLLELRHGSWTPVSRIPTRASTDSRMIYDTKRDRVVLFGGLGPGNQRLGDTWEYDGTSWARADVAGPGARADFAMAYDQTRGHVVVFGGFGEAPGSPLGDTWEYDGATWTRAATDGPSPRTSASMVYDSKRGLIILYGGGTDTWSWNGKVWTRLAETGPPKRFLGALAYDAARDRVVLFGGRPGFPRADANDTWEWDGSRWRELK